VETRQVLQGAVHREDGEDDGEEVGSTLTEAAWEGQIDQEERHADGADELQEWTGRFRGTHNAHVVADELAGRGPELRHHSGLEVVRLDDPVAGEGFRHHVGQLRHVRLHGAAGTAHLAAVDDHRQDAHRQHHQ